MKCQHPKKTSIFFFPISDTSHDVSWQINITIGNNLFSDIDQWIENSTLNVISRINLCRNLLLWQEGWWEGRTACASMKINTIVRTSCFVILNQEMKNLLSLHLIATLFSTGPVLSCFLLPKYVVYWYYVARGFDVMDQYSLFANQFNRTETEISIG